MNAQQQITDAIRTRATLPQTGEYPVLTLRVTRDVRVLGPTRTRFVGKWNQGRLETYRNEQRRFDFAPPTVSELLEVAVIDEGGTFRFELASEQHLWESHCTWANDPMPTVVADIDEDGVLMNRGIYTVEAVV